MLRGPFLSGLSWWPRKDQRPSRARKRRGRGWPALQRESRRLGAKKVVTTAVEKLPWLESAVNCSLRRRTNSFWSKRFTKRRIKVRKSAAIEATDLPWPETSARSRRLMRPEAQLET